MKIGNFDFKKKKGVFIIAELSANHNGDLDVAIETVKAAKRAGANCIKLQTYTADTLTINSNKKDFIIKDTIWDGQSLYNLYEKAYTPWDWHKKIFDVAKEQNLVCFSSPFDKTAVDFLEELDVPAYKVASFEITDIPLIEYIASKKKPIIISTGIAEKKDIELAIKACHRYNNNNIVLLKCTSSYPAPINEANLLMINDLAKRYNTFSGLSDHTIGSLAPIIATSLGARVIEKHFILNHNIGGPDSSFSMDEIEFKKMVDDVRKTEIALGEIDYSLTEKQKKGKDFSRSLYIVKDVKKGDMLSVKNVRSIRPGFGMHPKHYKDVIGKHFIDDYQKGTRLSFKQFN